MAAKWLNWKTCIPVLPYGSECGPDATNLIMSGCSIKTLLTIVAAGKGIDAEPGDWGFEKEEYIFAAI
ncbi:hypothetical protein [Chelativorans sp. AA-79]|uniref:hypothetical protein n=1 Tax=Chelativorans sp. AA-79 TaxID=3028735 RepID=UPI0023F8E0C1|nr:hypothetical protein [Chelativorans sp. AA-79]WEX07604.1 hypothetical protein PVE73_15990 [Chelativorans sp. AA-79]